MQQATMPGLDAPYRLNLSGATIRQWWLEIFIDRWMNWKRRSKMPAPAVLPKARLAHRNSAALHHRANFKVPDDWAAAIDLTELGESVVANTLASNRKVKPNEAKLAAFLRVGTPEGLLVSLATDLEALQGPSQSLFLTGMSCWLRRLVENCRMRRRAAIPNRRSSTTQSR